MKFADLHLHTRFSDGTFTPAEIVSCARTAGLDCIAITDHDTTEGLGPAFEAAGTALEVIPGIELTAEIQGEEIHLLGYFFDYRNQAFLEMLRRMREVRVARIYAICEKLKAHGVDLAPDEVFAVSGGGAVGRLHVARALFQKGCVTSIFEAFSRYIGNKGPAYVGKLKMTPPEAIDWILKVRGVPILAHPHTLRDRSLIADFIAAGLMGFEAFYPEHTPREEREFVDLAARRGLLVTGGSDCHGMNKDAGLIGKVKLPYEFVERLKEAQCRLA